MTYDPRIIDDKLRQWRTNYMINENDAVVYEGYVTGLSHHAYALVAPALKQGMELVVKPDPTNKYDMNATGIWYDGHQVGWIPKVMNFVASAAWQAGHKLEAVILRHSPTSGDYNNRLIVRIGTIKQNASPTLKLSEPKEPTIMKSVNAIVEQNISLGTSAAFLEAGRIANNQLSAVAGKKLPIMVRAYADTALGRLLLANIALMARDHFRPNDERLGKLVNAMTVSAYQEVLQTFDVEQMIEDMIGNSTIKRALAKFDEPAAEPKAAVKK